jgi:hypothetical protein
METQDVGSFSACVCQPDKHDRTLENGVRHLAVSSLSGIRPTWREMQRIKDSIAGCNKTAVEVYPPATEIVDQADMFHIWVLPEPLPFSLFVSQESDRP